MISIVHVVYVGDGNGGQSPPYRAPAVYLIKAGCYSTPRVSMRGARQGG